MKNNEGIFSFQEFSTLKDFCNNCAKEDKEIHEKGNIILLFFQKKKSQNQLNKIKYF